MATECPVCHRPIPFWRVIRTTAWGSWHCPDCHSKLGVDRKRRFLAIIPWTAVVLLVMAATPLMQYSMPLTLGVLCVFFLAIFYTFERATVLERVGFRCAECGYDLQGQVEPLCPECGHQLTADEQALLQRIRTGEPVSTDELRRVVSRRWGAGGIVILVFVGLLLAGSFAGLFVMSQANRRRPVSMETRQLLDSILHFVQNGNGKEPDHGLQHARADILTTNNFVLPGSLTDLQKVNVGGIALSDFDGLPGPEQLRVIERAITQLPVDVVAHRVGDFVFTYHGIDLPASGNVKGAAKDLWLVIGVPDPDQNAAPPASAMVPVGLADGRVVLVPWSDWSMHLGAQNELRRTQGLPPLPDPLTVTQVRPAREGGDSNQQGDEGGP